MIVVDIDRKVASGYEHMFGKKPGFSNHLRTWDEAGTVKVKTQNSPKLVDKGVHCVFLGCELDHASYCYWMWNIKTNGVHVTCNII